MTHTYDITGMHCQSCVSKVTTALQRASGVRSATVTLKPPQARVEMDQHVPTAALNDALSLAGDYRLSESPRITSEAFPRAAADETTPESLYPLVLIVGYIAGVVALMAVATRSSSAALLMNNFMAGFFLVFSFFKLLDLRGFADAYRSYDVVARALPAWGFVYPFAELGLGIAYLLHLHPVATNATTLIIMLVSSVGVLKALLDKKAIRCACLGTVLKLPMTKVTLVEDLGMAAMAAVMLVMLLT